MTESVMTNAIADATGYLDDHRAPLPAETRTYELTGFDPENGADHFSFEEWSRNQFARITGAAELLYEQAPTQGVEQKRLIEQVRTRYRKDNLSGLASLGTLEPRALPGDSFKLALTPGLIDAIFRRKRPGQADEVLLPNPRHCSKAPLPTRADMSRSTEAGGSPPGARSTPPLRQAPPRS